MTKITAYIALSLDGFVAREDGSVDWLPDTAGTGYDTFYKSVDTVIMGRVTYEQILTFEKYPYRDKKSLVFTRTSQGKEGIEFVSDVKSFVRNGFPNAGENIWLVGGAQLFSSFLKEDAVDEIIITVIPVILGRGVSLFTGIKETKLELVKAKEYGQLAELHYRVLK